MMTMMMMMMMMMMTTITRRRNPMTGQGRGTPRPHPGQGHPGQGLPPQGHPPPPQGMGHTPGTPSGIPHQVRSPQTFQAMQSPQMTPSAQSSPGMQSPSMHMQSPSMHMQSPHSHPQQSPIQSPASTPSSAHPQAQQQPPQHSNPNLPGAPQMVCNPFPRPVFMIKTKRLGLWDLPMGDISKTLARRLVFPKKKKKK
jgi:hypothetical protein